MTMRRHCYQRCLAIDPGDAVAAFNRANCLRAAGRQIEAAHDYARAIKLDPGFVEAWFNLAGLMTDRGRIDSARRHLQKAIALDPDYADADLQSRQAGIRCRRSRRRPALVGSLSRTRCHLGVGAHRRPRRAVCRSPFCAEVSRLNERKVSLRRAGGRSRHRPSGAWRRRADGFGIDDRDRQGTGCAPAFASPASSSATWRRAATASRKPPPRAETLNPEYEAAVERARRQRPADHRRQVDGRTRRQHGRRRTLRSGQDRRACFASVIRSIRRPSRSNCAPTSRWAARRRR